jgi:hypothetical protein
VFPVRYELNSYINLLRNSVFKGSNTAVRLKECSPKILTKHFKGLGSEFTELHAKFNAHILLGFAIYRRKNETLIRKRIRVKTMHVHSAVSRGNRLAEM